MCCVIVLSDWTLLSVFLPLVEILKIEFLNPTNAVVRASTNDNDAQHVWLREDLFRFWP